MRNGVEEHESRCEIKFVVLFLVFSYYARLAIFRVAIQRAWEEEGWATYYFKNSIRKPCQLNFYHLQAKFSLSPTYIRTFN